MYDTNKIKLIVCDIDGTLLLPKQQRLTEKTRQAFRKAMDKNLKIMINTGRHFTFLQESLFTDLPMDYIGTINGGCLKDRNGKTLDKHPMSEKTMRTLTEISREKGIGLGFKFEDAVVTYANHECFVEGYCTSEAEAAKVIDGTKDCRHHEQAGYPLGTFLICGDETIEELKPLMPEMVFAWSFRNGFDAFLKSVTKSLCVEPVLDIMGIGWENVIAFGDAGNDTDFIRKAGIGVAMGNAKDDVRSAADYVALPCAEDGVACALEDLGII